MRGGAKVGKARAAPHLPAGIFSPFTGRRTLISQNRSNFFRTFARNAARLLGVEESIR